MAVKYSFLALLKLCLNKIKFGIQSISFMMGSGGALFPECFQREVSISWEHFLSARYQFEFHVELEHRKDFPHWVVHTVLPAFSLPVS